MKTSRIAVIAATVSLTISGSSLAASHEYRSQAKGYSSDGTGSASRHHASSNLKKLIAPPGKGPVIDRVPFRHDGAKTSVNHTMLKTAPHGKGPMRSRSNSR